MKQEIIIIYGDKEKTCLEINQAFDYEFSDWPRASRRSWTWDDEGMEEAEAYMIKLADENNLTYTLESDNGQVFLD